MARGCREEQDDAIDDPGDVEDDDRHNGEEQSKSQDYFFVLLIGQGASPDGKLAKNRADKGEDQERKKAVKEQPE